MKIYIGADHGGFDLKNDLINYLKERYSDFNIVDCGAHTLDPADDYPDFAIEVAKNVEKDNSEIGEKNWVSLGILICRSGNGMCIAANKVKGAYAALAFSPKHSEMAKKDDNANIICLDADYKTANASEIISSFIEAEFSGFETRHGRRFRKVKNIENTKF